MRKTSAKAAWISAAMGRPGGDATPWVFSGTLVVKGHGLALVKQTGTGTELGRIGTALSTIEPERTPLQREVDRLVRCIAGFGLAAAAAVVIGSSLCHMCGARRTGTATSSRPRARRRRSPTCAIWDRASAAP